jgi:hypothetical protein
VHCNLQVSLAVKVSAIDSELQDGKLYPHLFRSQSLREWNFNLLLKLATFFYGFIYMMSCIRVTRHENTLFSAITSRPISLVAPVFMVFTLSLNTVGSLVQTQRLNQFLPLWLSLDLPNGVYYSKQEKQKYHNLYNQRQLQLTLSANYGLKFTNTQSLQSTGTRISYPPSIPQRKYYTAQTQTEPLLTHLRSLHSLNPTIHKTAICTAAPVVFTNHNGGTSTNKKAASRIVYEN